MGDKSRLGLRPVSVEGAVAHREIVIDRTQHLLGQAAALVDVIRSQFKYTYMFPDVRTRTSSPLGERSMTFTTPRIVLPAERVSTFRGESLGKRRLAADVTLYYDEPGATQKGIGNVLPDGKTPVPDHVIINYPQPLALPGENHKAYRFSDVDSVSGTKLAMIAPSAHTLFAALPNRPVLTADRDVLSDFGIFASYPPEELAQRSDVLDDHMSRVASFAASLGKISTALMDPTLNPRLTSGY